VGAACEWLKANGTSCAELIGFVTGVLYVVLAIRQKIWAWPVGLVNAAAFMVVFYAAGLYSDTALNAYYFVTSVYGWYHWRRGGRGERPALAVSRASRREWTVSVALGLAGWAVLGGLTSRLNGVAIPYVDALPVTFGLIAQWMTTRKLLENWSIWIVANVLWVGIYIYRGLMPTAVLFAIYLVLAIYGHREWKRSLVQSSSASS
jgi:nicotinamide mononucleotide transporter